MKDRVVVVTGGSSGIGHATALKLAEAGAKVLIVARDPEKLEATRKEIARCRRHGASRTPAISPTWPRSKARRRRSSPTTARVDYLINNAGPLDPPRRAELARPLPRFRADDAAQLLRRGEADPRVPAEDGRAASAGHIINISSIGVLSRAPRFSAYVASKSALDAFTECAASEFLDKGIHVTNINMPLVRTPMIAPTKMYENVPTLSPEEAAGLVVEAIVRRPVRIATRLGIFAAVCHAIAPKVTQVLLNTAFNMFPDSAAAQGKKAGEPQPLSPEQIAFAQLTQGIHW